MSMGGGTSTTTTTQELSPEQRKLIEPVIPIATDYLKNPPKQYAGTSIAGFDPLQQQAQQMTVNAANQMLPVTSAIPQQLQQIMGGYGSTVGQSAMQGQQGQQQLQGMLQGPGMNFMTSGAVLNANSNPALQQAIQGATRPIVENFQNTILPGITQEGIASGGFGGTRQGIAEGLAAKGMQTQIGDVAAQMMNQNYQAGLGAMNTALGTQIQGQLGGQQAAQGAIQSQQAGLAGAAGTLGNAGNILQQTTLPATTLGAVGGQQQAMAQAQLSEQVQKYINEQLIPFAAAQDVAAMAFGMPGGSTKSVSTAPGNPMAGAQMGMSALSALPALFAKSDRRLKFDIREVGKLIDGLTIYIYKYVGETVNRIGLMADEVERLYPEAINVVFGYKTINYVTVPSWLAYRSN